MREDWVECTFEELTESLKRGPFGGDLKKAYFVPKGHAVYEQQHAIGNNFSNIRYFIDDERYKLLHACNVGPGDYIVSCSGTMGKIARLSKNSPKGVINQALLRIRINEKIIDHNYFLEFFRSSIFQKKILKDSRGSGMQNMAGIREIKPIVIEIPPKPEQRAIVAKIEELFSDLDKGVADLKKAQDQLNIYRQAVLKKAFEGEFTKEWREQQTKNEEWESLTFNDVLEIISGKNQKHVEDPNGKYPIYGSGGIFGKSNQYLCEAGTTIIGRKGTINSPIYVNERFWNVDTAFGLSPSGKINSLFLFYFCLGFNFKRLDKSTTIPSLAKRDLLKIHINIPPQEEQHHIVQEIESRLSVCDKVEESITGSLEKAEVLRHSILKKAFEGNLLLTQEIEKCKTEPDYEPAAVLLEKIKNL